MVKKEFKANDISGVSVYSTIDTILKEHSNDYKPFGFEGDNTKLLCRTGYCWGTIAEITTTNQGDNAATNIIIECKPNPDASVTRQIQQEHAEKQMNKLLNLIAEYKDKPIREAATTTKRTFSPLFILALVVVLVATVTFTIVYTS